MEGISLESNLAVYFLRVIDESVERHSFDVSQEAKAYLVFLADKFFDPSRFHLSDIPLTLRLAAARERKDDLAGLQYLGDECLFLTGYFRSSLEKNGTGQVEYVSTIGSTAYKTVGERKREDVFIELSEKFPELSEIFRDFHMIRPEEDFTGEEIRRLAEAFRRLKSKEIIFPEGLN